MPPIRSAARSAHTAGRVLVVAALGAAACAAVPSGAVAATPPKPIVSPPPGTPDANPKTQISVLGVPPSSIRSVRATGAKSGAHSGKLRSYSGNRGASFLPATPFEEGERVDVVVRVRGRADTRSSFTVARLGRTQPVLNLKVRQEDKLQHFVSRPDLAPPKVTVHKNSSKTTGSIFMTPLPSPIIHPQNDNAVTINPVGPGGPMIVDRAGKLVWFRQLEPPDVAANLSIQKYRGKDVLTWWEGPVTPSAFGLGEAVIANSSYKEIARVKSGNGYPMDIHELRLTNEGDALFTIYSPVLVQLPDSPAGKLTPLLDAIVQQVDVRTGLVVWEWHALGHIPLSESYATPENSSSYDAYHFNSIQPLSGNRVLIGARNTSALYLVDRATGKIDWTLGGKKSDFRLGKGARFWFQHDALMLPGNRISMFDDQAGPPQKAPSSRGLVLQLDHKKKTANVARQYHRGVDTSAQSEGSTQTLPSGNVFVGWGAAGPFSEFSASGKLLFDASLPDGDGSYRTYRFPWSAKPTTRPSVVAKRGGSTVSVYASWNGATEVARWQVLSGGSPVGSAARTDFETKIDVPGTATSVAVRALDAKGRVLSTSATVPVS